MPSNYLKSAASLETDKHPPSIKILVVVYNIFLQDHSFNCSSLLFRCIHHQHASIPLESNFGILMENHANRECRVANCMSKMQMFSLALEQDTVNLFNPWSNEWKPNCLGGMLKVAHSHMFFPSLFD
jgi:hypothetical protein